MTTSVSPLRIAIIILLATISSCISACDATFTYQSISNNAISFTGNQAHLGGFTYFDTWTDNGTTVSNSATFNITFPASGTYVICHTLVIQDSNGIVLCSDTSCVPVTISIGTGCLPAFGISANVADTFYATFTNTVTNFTNLKIWWNFGDGDTLAGVASPTHRYTRYGQFLVKLFATDTVHHCTDSAWSYVTIDSIYHCQLSAEFVGSQVSYNTRLEHLTVLTSVPYQLSLWDFGDGTASSVPNPTHQYPYFGTYSTCLTLVDTIHNCNSTNCQTITIDTCSAQMADITVQLVGNDASASNYTLSSTGIAPLSFTWNFGDGTSESTSLNTNHIYSALGPHLCCFTATIAGCANIDTCITVNITCQLAVSFFENATNSLTEQFRANAQSRIGLHWSFGDGDTGVNNYPQHVYQQAGYYNVCLLAIDSVTGCRDTICAPVLVSVWNDTICGNTFIDLNLNGIQDSADLPLAGATIELSSSGLSTTTDSSGFYSMVVPGNTAFNIRLMRGGITAYTLPFSNGSIYTGFLSAPNQRQCGYDFGVSTTSASIQGYVYADLNHDSIYNNGDFGLVNQPVQLGGQTVFTRTNGNYTALVPVGLTNITANGTGHYVNDPVYPGQIPVNITTPGASVTGKNFGFQIPQNQQDVTIDLLPVSPVSLTTNPAYRLLVSNLSSVSAYYQANIVADPALTFDPAQNSGFTSNDPTSRTTSWIDNVSPFGQKLYNAVYDLSPSAVINQDVYNTASVGLMIGTDVNLSNDTGLCHQIVVASFDPNDKLSNQAGVGPQGYISTQQVLDYVIGFQNTGTAAAENIVVSDVISPNLDLSTFRFLASSHNCDVRITGDTVYFRFSFIQLPCVTVSETASHGWLAYSIQPKPNLPHLTQMTNTAAIYFDHNAPVLTNTTLHTIGGPESVTDIYTNTQLSIAPNPFSTHTTVEMKDASGGRYSYIITDVLGRSICEGQLTGNIPLLIERKEMSAGTYFFSLFNGTELVGRTKMVVAY